MIAPNGERVVTLWLHRAVERGDETRWALDLTLPSLERSDKYRKPAETGCRGYCRIEPLRDESTPQFVAFFSVEGRLNVVLDRRRYAWPGPYVAKREAVSRYTRRKRFQITRDGVVDYEVTYRFNDMAADWQGPEFDDALYHAAWITRNRKSVLEFVYRWEEIGAGSTLQDNELEERVQKKVARQLAEEASNPATA